MRVLSMIMLMTLLGASTVLPGQSRQEDWNLCKSHDPEQSIRGCSALIQSSHDTGINLAKAFTNRGSGYATKGDYDRAIQDFDQALQLNSNDAIAFFDRGLAFAHKGDYDRAIQDYDQALQLNPKFADAFY